MALPTGRWHPPRTERYGIGLALALLAHALLIVALALGLHWRNSPPVTMSAELWSALPQVAAPPPAAERAKPAPPPPPAPKPVVPRTTPPPQAQRQAEIAIERARIEQQRLADEAAARRQAQQEAERLKAQQDADRLKAQQLAEAKAREAKAAAEAKRQQELQTQRAAQAQAQQIAKAREENLKRMLAQAGAAAASGAAPTGTAPRDAGPSASYAGRIKARIKPNIRLLTEVDGNPTAEVEVRCAPDGEIIGRRIVKPSGNPIWDETVLRAIDITRVLPRDVDGRVPATMLLIFPRQE